MKLLALRCPHCDFALAPDAPVVVISCPNCGSAVLIADGGLSLPGAHYAAPDKAAPETWVPFWAFEGQVNIELREAQNSKISLSGWVSTHESQNFWRKASRYYIPAWDLNLPHASELARDLLESQPAFRPIERPAGTSFRAAVITPEDARKLLELVVVTVEARRSDWLKNLDFTLDMGPAALWVLPAKLHSGRWQLLAESKRS